jgi:hypothetical protein
MTYEQAKTIVENKDISTKDKRETYLQALRMIANYSFKVN